MNWIQILYKQMILYSSPSSDNVMRCILTSVFFKIKTSFIKKFPNLFMIIVHHHQCSIYKLYTDR